MKELCATIIDVIQEINTDMSDCDGFEYFNLTLFTDGFSAKVEFLDIDIWNSEMDDDINIRAIIRKNLQEEINKIAKIKI